MTKKRTTAGRRPAVFADGVILSRAAGATKNRVALVPRSTALLRHAILRFAQDDEEEDDGRPAGGRYVRSIAVLVGHALRACMQARSAGRARGNSDGRH